MINIDTIALQAATDIMALPGAHTLIGGHGQLKAKIQVLVAGSITEHAAQSASPQSAPVEAVSQNWPTEEMIQAGCLSQQTDQTYATYAEWLDSHSNGVSKIIRDMVVTDFKAMLAAAPQPEATSAAAAQESVGTVKITAGKTWVHWASRPIAGMKLFAAAAPAIAAPTEVERDAARYRFLRKIEKTACFWPLPMITKEWKAAPEEIDAAIDAAMLQGTKP